MKKNEGGSSESIISRLSQQLAALEKRDTELWLIVVGTGILVGVAMVAMLAPGAILRGGQVQLELAVSRELFVGLVALLIILNTYVISRRMEVRRTREEVISMSIQNELLRLQSFIDPLTEVYNRRALDELSSKYMRRAQRLEKPLTILLIDTDRFKEINTRFGHLTGDFVIAEISTLLQSAVRGSDAVVRYGGDEFLVILADAPLEGAKIAIHRIEKLVEDWNRAEHLRDFELSLSIGASEWAANKGLDELLTEADRNMYAAKEARNQAPR
jgi:diguanylate cyclase (GGDEF)-like protein